ncbi:hypothetical protein NUH86_00675 [Sphingobium sp. JS3065]|uniref:hypothetical protein n=1 Tax=Sphingobium sp. JS3065 TaxID=2970925 RepID=UPI002265426A|nr:hypothetical protein [Sphingobium sp. JS3065]UZW56973.1 hypothetical protein NUH86_00675 [Sphingobium sp. JS3065]
MHQNDGASRRGKLPRVQIGAVLFPDMDSQLRSVMCGFAFDRMFDPNDLRDCRIGRALRGIARVLRSCVHRIPLRFSRTRASLKMVGNDFQTRHRSPQSIRRIALSAR